MNIDFYWRKLLAESLRRSIERRERERAACVQEKPQRRKCFSCTRNIPDAVAAAVFPWTQLWINLFLILNQSKNDQTPRSSYTRSRKRKTFHRKHFLLQLRSEWNLLFLCFTNYFIILLLNLMPKHLLHEVISFLFQGL